MDLGMQVKPMCSHIQPTTASGMRVQAGAQLHPVLGVGVAHSNIRSAVASMCVGSLASIWDHTHRLTLRIDPWTNPMPFIQLVGPEGWAPLYYNIILFLMPYTFILE